MYLNIVIFINVIGLAENQYLNVFGYADFESGVRFEKFLMAIKMVAKIFKRYRIVQKISIRVGVFWFADSIFFFVGSNGLLLSFYTFR